MKKILTVSAVIFIIGICLIIYAYLIDCETIINSTIKKEKLKYDFKGRKTAVYIIRNVNKYCRPCSKYEQLKKKGDVDIIFYVEKDYSDYDIENFRDTFGILDKYTVHRIDNKWEGIFKKCNSNNLYNLLILVSEFGKVEEVIRF